MFPAPFRVVVDACALFPVSLCDTLLRAAAADYFQLHWSAEILDEARRNLGKTGISADKAAMRFAQMERAFPEAMVTGHEPLIDAMLNDPKDRHVVAAAVKAGAQVIVTSNLCDFVTLPDGIEAQSPDDFLGNLFDLDPDRFVALLQDQAKALKRPPVTFAQVLAALAKTAPAFAALVSEHVGLPPPPS
jgi:predicted nucleic acid-binding protein